MTKKLSPCLVGAEREDRQQRGNSQVIWRPESMPPGGIHSTRIPLVINGVRDVFVAANIELLDAVEINVITPTRSDRQYTIRRSFSGRLYH